MSENIIKVTQVKKYFGGVKALDGVDLVIKKGEIHCLAGENGCGKSTIINIISGFYQPDSGTIEIDGKEYTKLTTQQAIDAGIQVIYQDLSVFPNLTVRENLAITMEKSSGRKFVSKKRFDEIAKRALSKIEFQVDLDELVENLTVADKQLIAISRALLTDAKLIIMDEPTTAITQKEVKNLFNVIRDLQKQGIAILFVSHKLDEVFEIAERFTIFRSGKNVFSGDTKELTQASFTHYMTGRDIEEESFVYKEKPDAKTVLEVKNLSLANGFKDCSFSLKEGEILGITGLLGSGRTELAETILGIHHADSGEIYLDGEKVEIRNVQDAMKKGIGYVPPERGVEGLRKEMALAQKYNPFDEKTLERIQKFQYSLRELKAAFTMVAGQFLRDLIPHFERWAEIGKDAFDWMIDHADVVKLALAGIGLAILGAMGPLYLLGGLLVLLVDDFATFARGGESALEPLWKIVSKIVDGIKTMNSLLNEKKENPVAEGVRKTAKAVLNPVGFAKEQFGNAKDAVSELIGNMRNADWGAGLRGLTAAYAGGGGSVFNNQIEINVTESGDPQKTVSAVSSGLNRAGITDAEDALLTAQVN